MHHPQGFWAHRLPILNINEARANGVNLTRGALTCKPPPSDIDGPLSSLETSARSPPPAPRPLSLQTATESTSSLRLGTWGWVQGFKLDPAAFPESHAPEQLPFAGQASHGMLVLKENALTAHARHWSDAWYSPAAKEISENRQQRSKLLPGSLGR